MSAIDCYECGCGFSGEYDVFRVHVGWARIRRFLFGWWPWRKKRPYEENPTVTFIADLWAEPIFSRHAMVFSKMIDDRAATEMSVGDVLNIPHITDLGMAHEDEEEENDDER